MRRSAMWSPKLSRQVSAASRSSSTAKIERKRPLSLKPRVSPPQPANRSIRVWRDTARKIRRDAAGVAGRQAPRRSLEAGCGSLDLRDVSGRQVGKHVLEQLAAVVGGHGDVVGGDPGPVKGLHAEDVAVGAVVGEDAGVGDAEALQMVGDEGGGGVLQGQVEVDGVKPVAVEEVPALSGDDGLQVGSGAAGGDQGQVVIPVDLDVQLRSLSQRRASRGVGELATQLAQLQGAADDPTVALGGVDGGVVATDGLGVEESR